MEEKSDLKLFTNKLKKIRKTSSDTDTGVMKDPKRLDRDTRKGGRNTRCAEIPQLSTVLNNK